MLLPTEVGDEMSAGFRPVGRSTALSAATAFGDGGRKRIVALKITHMAAYTAPKLVCLMGWIVWHYETIATAIY